MPRRKGPEAETQALKAKNARWRYAIRNPEFRKELQSVAHLFGGKREEFAERFDALLKKWGFQYIGAEILDGLPYLPSESSQQIEFLEAYSDVVLNFPVFRTDTDNERIVQLEIDLSHPLDLLVSLAEEELREAIEELQTGPSGRRRLDKVDFYLKVYDLAEKGETFPKIAKGLNRPHVSTVKSAYVAACKNIYGVRIKPRKRTLPRDTFDWDNFDPEEHFKTCQTCQKAETADEMCPPLRLHVTQEGRGQREVAVLDTVQDIDMDFRERPKKARKGTPPA